MMNTEPTFYEVLEIIESASPETVKGAYKYLAQKWHPDKNPGNKVAANLSTSINAAYRTLSDPMLREQYDEELRLIRRDALLSDKKQPSDYNTPHPNKESDKKQTNAYDTPPSNQDYQYNPSPRPIDLATREKIINDSENIACVERAYALSLELKRMNEISIFSGMPILFGLLALLGGFLLGKNILIDFSRALSIAGPILFLISIPVAWIVETRRRRILVGLWCKISPLIPTVDLLAEFNQPKARRIRAELNRIHIKDEELSS